MFSHEMLVSVKKSYKKNGWVIIPNLLSEGERSELEVEMVRSILDIIFTNQGEKIDTKDPENLLLLSNPKIREQKLENPKIIWRGGNSRQPLIGKTTGMINIHYNPLVLDKIAFNRKFYRLLSVLYNTKKLVHTEGPERISIKATGATSMGKHIDKNPFYPDVNYEERIQALYCVKVDEKIKPENSGTLVLLENFCFYFRLFGELYHPQTGLEGQRFQDIKTRFFVLPGNFDKVWLPRINIAAKLYTDFCKGKEIETDKETREKFEKLKSEGYKVPNRFKSIAWKAIPMKPGDFICWSQNTPHYSAKNTSKVPRMVCYYSVFPVSPSWYGSRDHRFTKEMFENRIFYYKTNANDLNTRIKNPEEYKYLKEKDPDGEDYEQQIRGRSLNAKLTGFKSWFQ